MALKICPINSEKVDENVVRGNAILVVASLVAVISGGQFWLLGLLAADFFFRGFGPREASPFAQISRQIVSILNLKPQPIALAPKQFAARIGFFLSSLAGLFYLFGGAAFGGLMAATILVFAVLEGFLGICVACFFYPFVVRWQER